MLSRNACFVKESINVLTYNVMNKSLINQACQRTVRVSWLSTFKRDARVFFLQSFLFQRPNSVRSAEIRDSGGRRKPRTTMNDNVFRFFYPLGKQLNFFTYFCRRICNLNVKVMNPKARFVKTKMYSPLEDHRHLCVRIRINQMHN